MMLTQLDMINFVDVEARSAGFAIVRAGEGEVGLGLSLEDDGDIEVFLRPADCEKLLAALQQAISIANGAALAPQV